jgi:hypothetical protein
MSGGDGGDGGVAAASVGLAATHAVVAHVLDES